MARSAYHLFALLYIGCFIILSPGLAKAATDDLAGIQPRLESMNLRDYKILATPSYSGSGIDLHLVVTEGDFARDRTVFVGYRPARGKWEFTDVRSLAGGRDCADSWLSFLPRQPNLMWLAFVAEIETAVCVFPSDDGGRSWNRSKIKMFREGATKHEPSVKCNSASDCLLIYNSLGLPRPLARNYGATYRATGWSPSSMIGANSSIPHSFLPAGSPGCWWVFANCVRDARQTTRIMQTSMLKTQSGSFSSGSPRTLYGPYISESDLEKTGRFRYEGISIDICSATGFGESGVPRWLVLSERQGNPGRHRLVLMRSIDGVNWSSPQYLEPPQSHDYVAANLCFDPVKRSFYLFYLHLAATANTYSICYRVIDENSQTWPENEVYLESNIPGKSLIPSNKKSKALGNNLFCGTVYDGQIAIVYQFCSGDTGRLRVQRAMP